MCKVSEALHEAAVLGIEGDEVKVTYIRTQITQPPAVWRKLGQRITLRVRADKVMKSLGFEPLGEQLDLALVDKGHKS